MGVCKFFRQGCCKFGDNCRFEHYPDNRHENQVGNYRSHNRSWQSPSYVPPQGGRANSPVNTAFRGPQAGPGQLNPLDLVAAIKEDVIAMEEGGQWPLSCYTPLKDIGSFPGFHDTSMEEVRYEAYQAQACGTFDQYVKKIGDLIQGTRLKWDMLKNPNGQVLSVIEKMARGQLAKNTPSSSSSFSLNTYNFNSSPSLQSPSTFSLGSNAAFASQMQQQQPQAGNIFSNSQVPAAATSNFRFILPQQADSGGSTFVAPPSFPSPPPNFGGSNNFGQSGGMMFGNNVTAAPSMNAGITQPVAPGFFGNQPDPAKQSSIFAEASQTSATSQGSIFGSSGNPGTYSQKSVQPAVPDLSVYTPLAHLADMERKEYSAVTFTLGSIPLRPPARELCS